MCLLLRNHGPALAATGQPWPLSAGRWAARSIPPFARALPGCPAAALSVSLQRRPIVAGHRAGGKRNRPNDPNPYHRGASGDAREASVERASAGCTGSWEGSTWNGARRTQASLHGRACVLALLVRAECLAFGWGVPGVALLRQRPRGDATPGCGRAAVMDVRQMSSPPSLPTWQRRRAMVGASRSGYG